jgi:hypothetical protein
MPAIGIPYGECQRCGFTRRLNMLCREWTGLKVCRDTCLDPRPAELSPPKVRPEGVPVPGASPETEPVFGRSDGSDL